MSGTKTRYVLSREELDRGRIAAQEAAREGKRLRLALERGELVPVGEGNGRDPDGTLTPLPPCSLTVYPAVECEPDRLDGYLSVRRAKGPRQDRGLDAEALEAETTDSPAN